MPDVGSLVSFRISDVYLPDPGDVLARLTEANIVVGRVIEFSDCGTAKNAFAVVELREGQTVIVAVEKLVGAKEQP
ncbi:MAG: hypothetical protein JST11_14760 [Acidobacteria bacterium]|nr:hypothetical protein [Acidobacteriota bacterium]